VSGELRLFLAVEPPQAARDELAMWARGAIGRNAAVRRLPAGSLHLTLCFLGEQPHAAVEEITALLGLLVEPFATVGELAIGAPAWLPPRRPRVLAVEVADSDGALRALQGALVAELAASLGWQPPRERFRPHVTVARMRPGSERAHELAPTPQLTFAPVALTLFRSSLQASGAVYEPLASIPHD
jgi:2'-5' RNA ligase